MDEAVSADLQVAEQWLRDLPGERTIMISGDEAKLGALLNGVEELPKRLAKLGKGNGVVDDVSKERDGLGAIFVDQDPEALGGVVGL